MEDAFIRKLIRNNLYQYGHERDSIPLSEEDYKVLVKKIKKQKELERDTDLHDIINDIVYEYLTT
ncbi:YqzH family protein [Bacillus timonensis]|uniref:YqzH family protein n=1 Tax=Bacillus timonensis TaxID=1033734 RepID=UPI0002881957|nr:YqzH family protein [Bacillus timonensis]